MCARKAVGIMFGVLAFLVLTSCEMVENVGGSVGLANNFTIERWHSQPISHNNKILVAASPYKGENQEKIATLVVEQFSQYFNSVHLFSPETITNDSYLYARQRGYQFLVVVDTLAIEAIQDEETSATNYRKITVLLSVVDVIREQPIDKIRLTASSRAFPPATNSMEDLLMPALKAAGARLSGE